MATDADHVAFFNRTKRPALPVLAADNVRLLYRVLTLKPSSDGLQNKKANHDGRCQISKILNCLWILSHGDVTQTIIYWLIYVWRPTIGFLRRLAMQATDNSADFERNLHVCKILTFVAQGPVIILITGKGRQQPFICINGLWFMFSWIYGAKQCNKRITYGSPGLP